MSWYAGVHPRELEWGSSNPSRACMPQVKDALLEAGFHFVLHGHAHSAWLVAERWLRKHGGRELHVVAAPTLSSDETVESHGYNELCIHFEVDGPRVDVMLYERKGDSFHLTDRQTIALTAK